MRKTIAVLCLLLIGRVGMAAPAPGIPWIGSLKEATAQARAENKPLLIYLHSDYCGYCKTLERTTLQDSRVRLLAKEYVPCRMNGEREGKSTVQKYQVTEYPGLAIADGGGELISKTTGITDGDKMAHILSRDLPPTAARRLEAAAATSPGDVHALAVLAVLRAERGDIEAGTHLRDLLAAAGGSGEGLAAANHALGAASLDRGDETAAAAFLQAATASATDPREIVTLHLQLADCGVRLRRNTNAIAEWEWVRQWREATRDEKKDAKSKEEQLLKARN